jgi:hypothetical protein
VETTTSTIDAFARSVWAGSPESSASPAFIAAGLTDLRAVLLAGIRRGLFDFADFFAAGAFLAGGDFRVGIAGEE